MLPPPGVSFAALQLKKIKYGLCPCISGGGFACDRCSGSCSGSLGVGLELDGGGGFGAAGCGEGAAMLRYLAIASNFWRVDKELSCISNMQKA
jgi:hypothetical protein